MKPLPHTYYAALTAGPSGFASLSSPGLPYVRVAPPVEYDGPGDAWSPEHLLLASVASCFVMTFRAVARASRVEFDYVEVGASGTVAKDGDAVRFTEIVLRPRVTIPEGSDRVRVTTAIAKAESRCLVTASLVTPVHLEAEVVVAGAAAELVRA